LAAALLRPVLWQKAAPFFFARQSHYIPNYHLIYFDIYRIIKPEYIMATLAEIRKSKQLTMVNIAVQLGISQGYYSNLERGKRPFTDVLLKRTAKILGVPVQTTREAAKLVPHESITLKSWISSIRINGLPLLKAFRYHLESQEINAQTLDDVKLKKKLKEFIEENIGYSVLAELSENKILLNHVRERMDMVSAPLKNKTPNNDSKIGQQ
jgi:transcriptional regulator with XRE-family HTH domain